VPLDDDVCSATPKAAARSAVLLVVPISVGQVGAVFGIRVSDSPSSGGRGEPTESLPISKRCLLQKARCYARDI